MYEIKNDLRHARGPVKTWDSLVDLFFTGDFVPPLAGPNLFRNNSDVVNRGMRSLLVFFFTPQKTCVNGELIYIPPEDGQEHPRAFIEYTRLKGWGKGDLYTWIYIRKPEIEHVKETGPSSTFVKYIKELCQMFSDSGRKKV